MSSERNPTHVYKTPGRYTVRLRVKGPHGEDQEEKQRYILVKDSGEGGGGGQDKQNRKSEPKPPKSRSGPGDKDGRLEGDPTDQRKINPIPEELRHHHPGTPLEEKTLNVYTNRDQSSGQREAQNTPLEQVLPQFQRAAEDAIDREQIPPAYRDFVRRYYEDLHRK